MKKVLVISSGSFVHLDTYLNFYKKKCFEVILLAMTPYGGENDELRIFNLSAVDSKGPYWKKIIYLTSIFKAKKIIKEMEPDFIHAHYATSGGVVAWLASGKVPYMLTAHGSDVLTHKQSWIWKFLFRKIFKKAKLINAVSNEISEFIESLDIPKSKILRSSVGVDVKRFDNEIKRGWLQPKFVSTRAFEPVYNQKMIIEALKVLNEQGIEFEMLFVGEGSTRSKCEELVRRYKLEGQVSFMDRQPNELLPDILSNYNYYISASLSDGTSVSLLEAMTSGLIPIVSAIRSNENWMNDEGQELMFVSDDISDLVHKIKLAYSLTAAKRDLILRRNFDIVSLWGNREKCLTNLVNAMVTKMTIRQ